MHTLSLISRILPRCTSLMLYLFFLIPAVILGCGSGGGDEEGKPRPRPVTYMLLKKSDPSHLTRVTGSAESWKMEKVGFQVEGRVLYVVEPGVEIKGNAYDEKGGVLSYGTVMAELNNERHLLRLKEAKARVAARKADLDRREKEYRRQANLLAEGATSQKRYEQAESEFRGARARVREAQRVARQAEVDLRDTRLFSPFHGQVSKVHVIPGGYVKRGQLVVTMQMMDPMKVEIAVSPQTDRKINYNDLMKVYVEGYEEPIEGLVWLKDTVADTATRTFMVTLLLRNRRVEVGVPDELKGKTFYRTEDIMKLDTEDPDGEPPYYVDGNALHQDEEGYFLWKVEGLSAADLFGDFNPVFTVRKVRVVPGEAVIRVLQLFALRELKDAGGLDPANDLVTGKLPPGVKDGDTVFLSRKRWLLRPGELVHVDFSGGKVAKGFYVPAQAIIQDDGGHYVYLVREEESGEELARRIGVVVEAGLGNFRRIEPAKERELNEGKKLIIDGAHYLHDGDLINAFDEVEVSP